MTMTDLSHSRAPNITLSTGLLVAISTQRKIAFLTSNAASTRLPPKGKAVLGLVSFCIKYITKTITQLSKEQPTAI